jgi:hypothetical protein
MIGNMTNLHAFRATLVLTHLRLGSIRRTVVPIARSGRMLLQSDRMHVQNVHPVNMQRIVQSDQANAFPVLLGRIQQLSPETHPAVNACMGRTHLNWERLLAQAVR